MTGLTSVVGDAVSAIVVDERESGRARSAGVGGCLADSRRLRLCSSYRWPGGLVGYNAFVILGVFRGVAKL